MEEILDIIRQHAQRKEQPLNTRHLCIALVRPLVNARLERGRNYYGATCSYKALMPFPALKMASGNNAKIHRADECIFLIEIREGIEMYIRLLEKMLSK